MKTAISIAAGLLVSYATLVLALNHLDAIPGAACSPGFTIPAVACRLAGLGATLLLVPVSGILAFIGARRVLRRQGIG